MINFVLMSPMMSNSEVYKIQVFQTDIFRREILFRSCGELSFPSQSLSLGIPGAGFWNGGPGWGSCKASSRLVVDVLQQGNLWSKKGMDMSSGVKVSGFI